MLAFPTRVYYEADYRAFDAAIAIACNLPGFDAARLYEWRNDTSILASTGAPDDDDEWHESTQEMLNFFHVHREEAIAAYKKRHARLNAAIAARDPEDHVLLDQLQMMYWQEGYDFPPFDAFVRLLAQQEEIPWGEYVISVCW